MSVTIMLQAAIPDDMVAHQHQCPLKRETYPPLPRDLLCRSLNDQNEPIKLEAGEVLFWKDEC